jgi:hypothetical protein
MQKYPARLLELQPAHGKFMRKSSFAMHCALMASEGTCAPRRWPADAPRLKKRAFASHVYGLSLALTECENKWRDAENLRLNLSTYQATHSTVCIVLVQDCFNWHFIALVLKPSTDFQSSLFKVERYGTSLH